MSLNKVIKDLEGMRKAGFTTCNIQGFLYQLEKVASDKVVVPQYVANWYEENENDFEFAIFNYLYLFEKQETTSFKNWFKDSRTEPFQTLVKMHLFGYEVEEKKYTVRVKGITGYGEYLNKNSDDGSWFFASDTEIKGFQVKHTKEELEKGGFGWVFSCEGMEVTEVEER